MNKINTLYTSLEFYSKERYLRVDISIEEEEVEVSIRPAYGDEILHYPNFNPPKTNFIDVYYYVLNFDYSNPEVESDWYLVNKDVEVYLKLEYEDEQRIQLYKGDIIGDEWLTTFKNQIDATQLNYSAYPTQLAGIDENLYEDYVVNIFEVEISFYRLKENIK